MPGDVIGFAAVILIFGLPFAAIYAWYRSRKLKTEKRLAAIAKGVAVPMEPELPHPARSRRAGILLGGRTGLLDCVRAGFARGA